MYLSGVVIPDVYEDEQSIVVADADFEQVYGPQQYGDDDDDLEQMYYPQQYGDHLRSGDEGFGLLQARALKKRLTSGRAGRRRLRVGRRPNVSIVGGSILYPGFGIAPLAVAGGAVAGVKKIGRVFKKPAHKVAQSEGPKLKARALAGDAGALAELQRLSLQAATAKAKSIYRKFYDQTVAELRARGSAVLPPPSPVRPPATGVYPTGPVPAPGPAADSAGGVAPVLPPVPSPIPAGEKLTPSESIAAKVQEEGTVEVEQPGMLAGIDPKVLLIGGGLLLFVMMGKGKRGRRR